MFSKRTLHICLMKTPASLDQKICFCFKIKQFVLLVLFVDCDPCSHFTSNLSSLFYTSK